MKRVVRYLLAAIAAPFVILVLGIALGFGLALNWLVGDDL